jgi:hypothetical protein
MEGWIFKRLETKCEVFSVVIVALIHLFLIITSSLWVRLCFGVGVGVGLVVGCGVRHIEAKLNLNRPLLQL